MKIDSSRKNSMEKVFTVKDLNVYVKSLLRRDDNIQNVWVRGEISNFTHYNNKHMYFELKDENSIIDCAMFRASNRELDFTPEDGMEVLCRGDVGLYIPSGKYQLIVNEMLPEGKGKLYLAYEKLKKKLSKEGLFDEKHKKIIPKIPEKVGIVTSEEAAALRDIVTVTNRRFPNIDLILSSTPVQGKDAAPKIAEAIKKLDRFGVDVIIVSRGGGSLEDLWNFNEEIVARAIFNAETPMISAVGHETDLLISDLVADYRAPTPSAAAEKAVPEKKELSEKLEELKRRAGNALLNIVSDNERHLKSIIDRPIFQRPELILEEPMQLLDELKIKIQKNMELFLKQRDQSLKGQLERLRALSPESTLKRGYSVVLTSEDELIKSVDDVKVDDKLNIKMNDGMLKAITEEVIRSKKKKK
ncbi:MAG: exodeoxyribonuclease VII large subunit [Candidatus Saliniplasma sp.]